MAKTYATWNPADKHANVTLSNGNLKAAVSGGWYSVRATIPKTAGKHYWELTLTARGTACRNGVGSSSAGLTTAPGDDVYGWGWQTHGYIYHNGTSAAYGAAQATADIISIALDLDNGKIWFGKNGVWPNSGNPETGAYPAYTGVTGNLFPMLGAIGGTVTANFGASAFAYTPPVGFAEGVYTEELQDVIITPDPLSATAALSSTPSLQIAPPALEGAAALSVLDIFLDRLITVEPFILAGALSANLRLEIVTPALAAIAVLDAGMEQQIIPGALVSEAILQISDIYKGFYIEAPPLTGLADLSASLQIDIVPDPLTGETCFTLTGLQLQLSPPAMAAAGSLSMTAITTFIDADYQITYLCVLTGAPDITLPISSFQGRFKSGDPSFLSVVIPGMEYAGDIAARSTGDIKLYMIKTYPDGNQVAEMIGSVALDDIRTDKGGLNQTITLSGHRTETFTPKTITLAGASYKMVYGGLKRYRCQPDLYLRPGDTVIINDGVADDTFTADVISWAISVASELMEVAEE